MIKADHKKWARLVFNFYIERQLKKNFSDFRIAGPFPSVPAGTPLIITPNHISWWDGFFIDYICRNFIHQKFHIMMLEEELGKYPFFRKLGAYSISPGNAAAVLQSIDYTGTLLGSADNLVVLYPQGEIEPFEKRPLSIKHGLKAFLRKVPAETLIMPAAFKIQYYNRKHPSIIFRGGELLKADEVRSKFGSFEYAFYDNLEKLSATAEKDQSGQNIFTERGPCWK